jgi:hypothetical protein
MSFSDLDVTFTTTDDDFVPSASSVPQLPTTTQPIVHDPGMSFLLSFDNTPAAQSFLSLLQLIVAESVAVNNDSERSTVASPPLSFPQMHSFSQNVHSFASAFEGVAAGLSVSSTVARSISQNLEALRRPQMIDSDTDDSFGVPVYSYSSSSLDDDIEHSNNEAPSLGFAASQDNIPFDDLEYDASLETSTIPACSSSVPIQSFPPRQVIPPVDFWTSGPPNDPVPSVALPLPTAPATAPLPFVPSSLLPRPTVRKMGWNPYLPRPAGTGFPVKK